MRGREEGRGERVLGGRERGGKGYEGVLICEAWLASMVGVPCGGCG